MPLWLIFNTFSFIKVIQVFYRKIGKYRSNKAKIRFFLIPVLKIVTVNIMMCTPCLLFFCTCTSVYICVCMCMCMHIYTHTSLILFHLRSCLYAVIWLSIIYLGNPLCRGINFSQHFTITLTSYLNKAYCWRSRACISGMRDDASCSWKTRLWLYSCRSLMWLEHKQALATA